MSDADEIRRLRKLCSDLERVHQENEERYGEAADVIERLQAELELWKARAYAKGFVPAKERKA